MDHNTSTATGNEAATIFHQANRKKKKRNKMMHSTNLHETAYGENPGKKRKLLETDMERVDLVPAFGSISKQSSQNQVKMARISPHTLTGEATWAIDGTELDSGFSSETSPPSSGRNSPCLGIGHSNIVALDCEMVGTGLGGKRSEVARCSIVNYYGSVVYDKYILPLGPVVDYRTRWSGIRKFHLERAIPFTEAQKEISSILDGKVIIGHALSHDFAALNIFVPEHRVRDTCSCRLLRNMYHGSCCAVSLKKLSQKLLNRSIQVGRQGHCSVEDSQAALDLYKLVEDEWEKDFLFPDLSANKISDIEDFMQDQYWPENLMDSCSEDQASAEKCGFSKSSCTCSDACEMVNY